MYPKYTGIQKMSINTSACKKLQIQQADQICHSQRLIQTTLFKKSKEFSFSPRKLNYLTTDSIKSPRRQNILKIQEIKHEDVDLVKFFDVDMIIDDTQQLKDLIRKLNEQKLQILQLQIRYDVTYKSYLSCLKQIKNINQVSTKIYDVFIQYNIE